jgi:hypothetical protein
MKSGAVVLVASVRLWEDVLVVPLPFPFGLPLPLPVEACLWLAAAFFFVTPAVDFLLGSFFAAAFLVLAMA